MKITKRQLRRIIEQIVIDKTIPEHFDSGENIDVYDYETKHFEICASAVEPVSYTHLTLPTKA